MEPLIQYTTASDGVSLAYREFGDGPPLVVLPMLPLSHLQAEWQVPGFREWFSRFAQTHRVIRYDARGTGLSARTVMHASLDDHVRDLEAVLQRAGREPVALFTASYAGPIGIAFAARHPELVSRMVLWCTHASMEDVAGRLDPAQADQREAINNLAGVDWDLFIRTYLHRAVGWTEGDQANQFAQLARQSIEPEHFVDSLLQYASLDARGDLAQVQAPTLVLHRPRFPGSNVEVAKGLTARIRNASLILLEGESIAPFIGDSETALRAVEDFLGAGRSSSGRETTGAIATAGVLRTLLFTDIEGHTHMMRRLGDQRGREVLRYHERVTRDALRKHGGLEVKSLGDGFLASFDSAQRALECATALQRAFEVEDAVGEERLSIRVGVNAGEPIAEDDDLFGSSVITAARIASMAKGGEILASMVVRELVAGKGFVFADRGEAELRGFDDPVRLYELHWRQPQPA